IGGAGDDAATNLRVGSNGTAYVVGETESSQTTFPVVNGPELIFNGQRDAFVAKVKSAPTSAIVTNNFEYCGYIGSAGLDAGFDVAVDSAGSAYMIGDGIGATAAFVAKIATGVGRIPTNDDFDHATTISALPFTNRINTFFGTPAPDDPEPIYGECPFA